MPDSGEGPERRLKEKLNPWTFFDDRSNHVDRFGLLLGTVTILVAVLLTIDIDTLYVESGAGFSSISVTLLVGATFLLAMRASGVSSRFMLIGNILVGVSVTVTVLIVLTGAGSTAETAPPPFTWVILALFTPVFVIRRISKHRRATARTVLGAISAFLLIGVAFTFIFLTLDGYGTTTFFAQEEPSTSFMYFSLVTLTTLGYGDLSSVTTLGRAFSTAEAIIGQVYLVVYVAMIVGLVVAERQAGFRVKDLDQYHAVLSDDDPAPPTT